MSMTHTILILSRCNASSSASSGGDCGSGAGVTAGVMLMNTHVTRDMNLNVLLLLMRVSNYYD